MPDEDDLTVTLADLRHWDEAPANPRRLLDAGLTVAFTSHGLAEPKTLHANLARALERGLTADEALAALTTTPARLLGIADRAGTVSAGKMANLVVVEGELFTDETRVREVWIDGRHYEVKEVQPPEVEPAGTWQLTVETPDGQQIPVTPGARGRRDVADAVPSPRWAREPLALSSAPRSRARRSRSASTAPRMGMPGTISLTLEIDGEDGRRQRRVPQRPVHDLRLPRRPAGGDAMRAMTRGA